MGWWLSSEQGHSFADDKEAVGWWGDGPADTIDAALDDIYRQFNREFDRNPTKQELISGFLFSVGLTSDDGTRYGEFVNTTEADSNDQLTII